MERRQIVTDILVAGGGTAGCAAAIAAARRGHRVLLVEEENCLGGVSTAGGVNQWFASLDGLGDVWARIRAELQRYGAGFGFFFNGEYLKVIWQLLAEEAGVDILLHASAVSTEAADGRVTRVGVSSCSRGIDIESQYFVDATGEGDLAALAGAEFMQGHPESGRVLHMSLTFTLYDTGRPVEPYLPPGLEEIRGPEDLPGLHGGVRLPDGRVYCNMTKVMGLDPTDPLDLSLAEREARRQLIRIAHYLQRTRFPTYMLASSGAKIGIREGRRIVGEYILTEQDITGKEPRDFADGIAVGTSQIDFHSLSKPGHGGWRQRVEPYAIPFRCLIVKGFKNLLVAGKCISGDQVAESSYRMTPTCCALGQAAGMAAALAIESQLDDIRRLDVMELRAALAASGVELAPGKHQAYAPEITPDPARGL